jgi:hypothetical protein
MVTVKIHCYSIVSTKGARYYTMDLNGFYLNTLMERPEFMRMKLAELPKDFAGIYKLHGLVDANGFVSIKSKKECMAFLEQAFLCKSSSKNA